jgi:hypothetical protein
MILRHCFVLGFSALVVVGCDYAGPTSDAAVQKRAQNDALWAERVTVRDGAKAYAFSADRARGVALIAPAAAGFAYTVADLERITAAQTECKAVFQDGILDLLKGYSETTNLRSTQEQLDSFNRWQLKLDC